ncbi:MAG: transposase zinc-binding domain-containing protein [Burkholderiales bacterium]|nr:transposase zinc-binding domain-containing protein [Burkholderiales bacterium]
MGDPAGLAAIRAILAHGFARGFCKECGCDFLVAFSCQGRAECPSCNARRMVATAAHLFDHVLPPLPLRQWVLSVPKRLRYFLHEDAALQGVVVRILLRVVERCLREHSPGSSAAACLGAVVCPCPSRPRRWRTTIRAGIHPPSRYRRSSSISA